MKKTLSLLVAFSVLALAYCVLGLVQTGMLAGAPNYSPVRAEYNEHLWISLSGVFLGLSVFFFWLRMRMRRRERGPSQPDQQGKTCP
jgi:hypothetical protein